MFDVRLSSPTLSDLTQMESYCSQIFIKQPNRNFVRALIFARSTVQLIHYDRGGMYISHPIDIDNEPHSFIRLGPRGTPQAPCGW